MVGNRLGVFVGLVTLLGVVPAAGRVAGFHVDDESCSGLLMNNETDQKIKCAAYFGSLANLSATLARYSAGLKGPPLTLTVDAGTAWTCPTARAGCFNLTFGGKTQSVAEHVIDLADAVVLMDYDRNYSNVVQRAADFLAYADTKGKGSVAVSVGLAIAPPPHATAAAWQTRNESELAAVMAASRTALARYASFDGFAVFFGQTWRNSSGAAGDRLAWPKGTGVWYLDHGMVLDASRRAEWLRWARSRGVGAAYIAPHAGNTALISIPGVEGSAADDAKFCDFIHEAEAVGIDVQLLSTPALDIAFIRNCSARS